jgi:hypothetical protein
VVALPLRIRAATTVVAGSQALERLFQTPLPLVLARNSLPWEYQYLHCNQN